MTRRLIVAYVSLTILALAILATPLGITFAHREHDRLLFESERSASEIGTLIEDTLEARASLPVGELDASARRMGAAVVIVDSHGVVMFDSEDPTRVGENLADAKDFKIALQGTQTTGREELEPSDRVVAYATAPTTDSGVVDGAVRVAYPTATLDRRIRDVWLQLGLLCLAVLAAVVIVGSLIARGITRPLRNLERATDRLGRGDLTTRLDERDGPQELRRVASTFNRMAIQLSGLIASQAQFVSNASHQLRSPLTALRLRLDNLEADADAEERDQMSIRAASAEVTRMSRLIDGLLVLASDAARREHVEPVDIAAVARDRVIGWDDVAAEHDVRIDLEAPATEFAQTLPSAPEQMLDNLIDNALSVAPPDTTITVVVRRQGSNIEMSVLDRGPGLDADSRSRAFDRFWRAPNASAGGTGLGLAIVRQLAEASGGDVRLDAREGGGLAAIVTLPRPNTPRPTTPRPHTAG